MPYRVTPQSLGWIGLLIAWGSTCPDAEALTYEFRGHFEATTSARSESFVPYSPPEIVGREFSIRIAWPSSAEDYATPWRTGDLNKDNPHVGTYTTPSISLTIDVPGLSFSSPPIHTLWETLNDTELAYDLGVPLTWGDELRLWSQIRWARTVTGAFDGDVVQVDPMPVVWEHPQVPESFTYTTDYTLVMHAADYSGLTFSNDSLQVDFDLSTFDEVWFDVVQVVPVAGNDPRPIYFEHFRGAVDAITLVPEPATSWIALAALLVLPWAANAAARRRAPCLGRG